MTTELRELARGHSVGNDVVLSWNPATRRVFVDVADEVDGASFRIVVDGADALDAFNQPEPIWRPRERLGSHRTSRAGEQDDAALGIVMTGVASFMVALDTLVVSTALTPIRLDLDASLGQLEWTILIARPDLPYWQLVAQLMLAGCGVSLAMVAAQATVVSDIAREDIGKASGAFTTFRFFGGAFGIAILAAVFAGRGSYASPHSYSHRFVAAAALAAVLSAVGAAIGLAVPGRRTVPTSVDAVTEVA
jgi:hypothetical protein